jgi:hypothetical protein
LHSVDGPDGPTDPTPHWVTTELLDHCITAAARWASVSSERPDGTPIDLRWGEQVDFRPIRPAQAHEVEDEHGSISEAKLAGYVAKYATKAPARAKPRTARSAPSSASTSCGSPSTTAA